jgi:hypothetical protein
MKSMNITTHFDPKPVPDRGFDWIAVGDGYDGAPDSACPIGHGRTESEAVADLERQIATERLETHLQEKR